MTKKKRNQWMLLAAAGGIGYLIYSRSKKQKAAALPVAQGNYLLVGR